MLIFKKCSSLLALKVPFFDKPPYCPSKLCNSFLCRIVQKRKIGGLFQNFEAKNCLEKWFFVQKFSNKAIFGTNRAQKAIEMAWIPEEWVCICMKLWNFSMKWHFWAWTRPFFEMKIKIWIFPFCFSNRHMVGPWQGPPWLLKGPKQLYLAFLHRLGYEFSQKMAFGPFSHHWQIN